MRPDPRESLRAIQAAVGERFTPELSSLFALEAAQAVTMLTESLAAEADTLAEDLQNDNAAIRAILTDAAPQLQPLLASNKTVQELVQYLDDTLREAGDGRIAISSLAGENNRMLAALERLVEFIEDTDGEPGAESLTGVRQDAYRHLRRVAARGWCFFDVSAFRERIVSARAELAS